MDGATTSDATLAIACHVLDAGTTEMRTVRAPVGRSLMRGLKEAGTSIEAACEGNLACGTCLVHFDDASFARLPAPEADEAAMLDWLEGRRRTSRLSCQIRVAPQLDGLSLEIAAGP